MMCPCRSIASTGDPCVQPEGGLGLSGVPRLKLMLTRMEQESLEAGADDSPAADFTRADYAAPEVRPHLLTACLPGAWHLSDGPTLEC